MLPFFGRAGAAAPDGFVDEPVASGISAGHRHGFLDPHDGAAGSYTLQVWARSIGQPTYEAWTDRAFTIAP